MSVRKACAALSIMLVVAAGACSAYSGNDSAGGGGGEIPAAQPAVHKGAARALASEDSALGAGNGGSGSGMGYTATDVAMTPQQRAAGGIPDIGPSVIKTATVVVEVGDDHVQRAIQSATSTAEKYGGFVISTTSSNTERASGDVIIRVPAVRFATALADLEGLGDVRSENISGQDVSQEFIDLEARLRNFTAQETVLLRLMDRAQSVVDTIRVQNELQGVQLEIERLHGRLSYLRDQTDMSTIEMRVVEAGAVASPPGDFERAWERAKDGFIAVLTGLIASLGVVVPIALLSALAVFVFVRLRPKARTL